MKKLFLLVLLFTTTVFSQEVFTTQVKMTDTPNLSVVDSIVSKDANQILRSTSIDDFKTQLGISDIVTTNTNQLTGLTGNKTWDGTHIFNLPVMAPNLGIEGIDEGNGFGYASYERNPLNYGPIGYGALDLSVSTGASSTKGSLGSYSFSLGEEMTNPAYGGTTIGYDASLTVASTYGVAYGQNVHSDGYGSRLYGRNLSSTGEYNLLQLRDNTVNGDFNIANGTNIIINADSAHGYGDQLVMTGHFSRALGTYLFTRSLAEVAVGHYNTDYVANSAIAFDPLDRAFSIGVGVLATPADGMIMLKNGTTTFPELDISEILDQKSAITLEYLEAHTQTSTIDDVIGETVSAGDVLYLNTDGKYWISDATAETSSSTELVVASESGVADDTISLFLGGNLSGFSSLSVGQRYYIEVGGGITDDRSGFVAGNISRYIGTAKSSTVLKFNPSGTFIEIN